MAADERESEPIEVAAELRRYADNDHVSEHL
jgi:hypothetical protein